MTRAFMLIVAVSMLAFTAGCTTVTPSEQQLIAYSLGYGTSFSAVTYGHVPAKDVAVATTAISIVSPIVSVAASPDNLYVSLFPLVRTQIDKQFAGNLNAQVVAEQVAGTALRLSDELLAKYPDAKKNKDLWLPIVAEALRGISDGLKDAAANTPASMPSTAAYVVGYQMIER